uniref:Uncharacterized protein n=1 Tax=Arundo donax TaxID=35708 RepID=A0A0A9EKQ9_ARUDO
MGGQFSLHILKHSTIVCKPRAFLDRASDADQEWNVLLNILVSCTSYDHLSYLIIGIYCISLK